MSTPLSPQELSYWLAFSRIPCLGPVRWKRLLESFDRLEEAWSAPPSALLALGFEAKIVDEIHRLRPTIDPEAASKTLETHGLGVMTIIDDAYPPLLRQIYAPPPLLYTRGSVDWQTVVPFAIVGTRNPSEYGQRVTRQFASELAAAGLTIVSGLAFGVDSIAHLSTLDVRGTTVGVLAGGLDQVYPASNRRLADELIAGGGQLLSEFAPGTPSFKSNFHQRNRIIAGLSLGTLVVEAKLQSGALITSAAALEQNREVFAVPGSIFSPLTAGPHQLLRHGATLVESSTQILETLNLKRATPERSEPSQPVSLPDPLHQKIYELLTQEPLHVDKLIQSARLDVSVVTSVLTLLELRGVVLHVGGSRYVRK